MALNAIYDTQEAIPEAFRELFSQRNGKWELTGITGIKTQADVDRVTSSLETEREAHKRTKNRLRPVTFKGRSVVEMNDDDLTAAVTALDKYDELEASVGKIDDDKLNQIVESRIKTRLAPVERERDQLKTQIGESTKQIETFTANERRRKIHDAVRKARITAKVIDTAEDDVLLLAERVFDVADDGAVVTRDQVGCTPGLDPEQWLTDMADKRPHWWPESSGGGARGGRQNGGGGGKNPWSKANWNLTAQGQYIKEHGTEKAEQMAALANSRVGATSPTAA